ncbi:MAG: DUF1517 domain-containing protein [Sandaracinaceae bacterium]|nr:DUF1517 domain-containing protein [Sandaracinaceae bacterium]
MRTGWAKWVLAIVAALFLSTAALPVIAQSTGGSFGGGSFGGGGGGGGSYGGGGGSYGGGSYGGSYSGGGYSGGGGGGGLPLVCSIPIVLIFVVFWVIQQANKNKGGGGGGQRYVNRNAGWNQMDISAIRLGIDWRARKMVQERLTQLASSGQTNTPAGLANLLRETILMLRRAEIAWLYASVANYHPMSAPSAEGIFRQLGTAARAQFREELIRNADGSTSRRDAPQMQAHKHEGEGVVVITLIVAAKREIIDIHTVDHADHLKRLLDDMTAVANPHTLAAMEVIWSPAAENDRMSTAELEQHYPDLKKIDERSIAGRYFCEYCRGPYAMELLTCPHCGAPAPTGQPRHG